MFFKIMLWKIVEGFQSRIPDQDLIYMIYDQMNFKENLIEVHVLIDAFRSVIYVIPKN